MFRVLESGLQGFQEFGAGFKAFQSSLLRAKNPIPKKSEQISGAF